ERLAGRKYCGACGSRLRPSCARKQVTVLFTDVCDFTGMSERLDPEDVRALIDRAFDVILDAVHRHGGTINQFLGDGVMALFGDLGGGVVDGKADSVRAYAVTREIGGREEDYLRDLVEA